MPSWFKQSARIPSVRFGSLQGAPSSTQPPLPAGGATRNFPLICPMHNSSVSSTSSFSGVASDTIPATAIHRQRYWLMGPLHPRDADWIADNHVTSFKRPMHLGYRPVIEWLTRSGKIKPKCVMLKDRKYANLRNFHELRVEANTYYYLYVPMFCGYIQCRILPTSFRLMCKISAAIWRKSVFNFIDIFRIIYDSISNGFI